VVIGCGNVKHSAPDASVTVDAPPDGAPVRTAISADGIVAFNIAPSTFTKVPYTHVAYDDRGEFDASNARFTASHDGDYEVCASVFLHTLAKLEIDLFVDGSRERALAHGVGAVEGCRVERLAKGSTLEVWAYHDAATPLAVTNDAYWDWLTIHEQRASVSLVNINAFQAPPNTFTIVPYSTEVFDDHNEFDLNQSRFVAANAGDYEICASIALGNGNVGYLVQPSLYVNGNRERELFGSPDGDTGCHVVRLATGDVVDVRVYHTASTTLSISADPLWDWLTVQPVTARVAVGDTTSFAVPNATFTRVPYSSVLFNDEGEFDASIGRFTPKASGDYEICAALWDGRNSTKFELDIFVDGSREKAIGQPDVTPAGCRVVRLAAGAKLDIVAWQASGQTVTVPSNIFWNWLTVRPL
jgi:hypothetical protein